MSPCKYWGSSSRGGQATAFVINYMIVLDCHKYEKSEIFKEGIVFKTDFEYVMLNIFI